MTVRRPPQPRSNRSSGRSAALGTLPSAAPHGVSRDSASEERARAGVRKSVDDAANEGERQIRPGERTDWQFVWEGEKKSHQFSLRAVAVLGFAALAVLIVITPLRSFITQQEQIRELNSQVQASKDHIEELKESIALWNDPAYVQAQARERLGYVMPGQTLYVVTGGDSDPQKQAQEKVDKANQARRAITPFYVTMWDSISVAGQASGSENPQNVPVIHEELAGVKPADTVPADTSDEKPAKGQEGMRNDGAQTNEQNNARDNE